jgi:hypothetical protein
MPNTTFITTILSFDKDFVSPLSRTGINVYNYVLADTAVVDNKYCYNIVFTLAVRVSLPLRVIFG